MGRFKRNARLVPEGLKIRWQINTVMDSARGLGDKMIRPADWRKHMSCNTDQEQDEQKCQGESSEGYHLAIHVKRDRDRA